MISYTDDRTFTLPVTTNWEPRVSVKNVVDGFTWRGEGWQIPSAGDASTACRRFYSSFPIEISLRMYIQHSLLTLWEQFITILTLKWVNRPTCLLYFGVRAHNTLFGAVSLRRCQRYSLYPSMPWYERNLSLRLNPKIKLDIFYVCRRIANVSLTIGDLTKSNYVLQLKSLWSPSKGIITRQPSVRL